MRSRTESEYEKQDGVEYEKQDGVEYEEYDGVGICGVGRSRI